MRNGINPDFPAGSLNNLRHARPGLLKPRSRQRRDRGVLDVQEAVVRGRLYEIPSGIPVLEVPETDILAHGTADPLADVATQARPAGHLASYL